MNINKKFFYILLFAILYCITAFSSFWHSVEFFGLANNSWMSIILAFAFEVGQAAVLFSLLTSSKDRSRIMPWVLMSMFTLVQVIGNVYSSYKYIILNSVENLRYFKEPIFIWTDLPDDQANVIIVYLVGALLPIAALLLTSMITNYLTDQSAENNTPILVPEITSEKGPDNPPIEIHNTEEFEKVYNDDENEQEIKNLNVEIDKKNEEINNLKKELEQLKNDKLQFEEEKNKFNSNDGEWNVETIENKSTTENKTSEDIASANDKTNDESNSTNDQQGIGQIELEGDKSINETNRINNNEDNKIKQSSHFINL